jgi:hypothetical protein
MLSAGFEPATFRLGGERSIQLSYESLISIILVSRFQIGKAIIVNIKRNRCPSFQSKTNSLCRKSFFLIALSHTDFFIKESQNWEV